MRFKEITENWTEIIVSREEIEGADRKNTNQSDLQRYRVTVVIVTTLNSPNPDHQQDKLSSEKSWAVSVCLIIRSAGRALSLLSEWQICKKKPWCDLNCASNICSGYWDMTTAGIRFLSACCTLSTPTLPRTKFLSADLENETKLLIEISRSSLRISALWSPFQLSDLWCSVLLAHTWLSQGSYSSFFHHPLTWALTWGLICLCQSAVYSSIIVELIWRTIFSLIRNILRYVAWLVIQRYRADKDRYLD